MTYEESSCFYLKIGVINVSSKVFFFGYCLEMGRTCVTPCCRTGYPLEKGKSQKIGPKPALFKAPKGPDLFKNWKQNLPRKEFLLTKSSFVSELHFLPEDVQNTYSGVPSDITALQTVRKRLRPGAVPVLWPGKLWLY